MRLEVAGGKFYRASSGLSPASRDRALAAWSVFPFSARAGGDSGRKTMVTRRTPGAQQARASWSQARNIPDRNIV